MKAFSAGQQIDVPGLKKFDQASATTLYIGEARPGSADADASWQIRRITFDISGNPTKVEWAGDGSATNSWSLRASIDYA